MRGVRTAVLALLLVGLASLPPARALAQPDTRPNIVFVLVDDLDAAMMANLPGIVSLLGGQGASFENYLLNVSLCCPSRTTTLRGQYGHSTTILTNSPPTGGFERVVELGLEGSTIATWLQDAGYRTALFGKYLNGYPEARNRTYVPPGWSEWYAPTTASAYGEYNYTLNENGRLTRHGNAPEDYFTDVMAERARGFIRRAAAEGQPFFMYVAPYAPHAPATPAPRHLDAFPGVQAPRTPNFDEADVSDKPAWIRNRPNLGRPQIAAIDRLYRLRQQSMLAVQEMVESLVQTLAETGQLERTYILFASDNGFHLGNHRLVQGKQAPYEEDIRSPLFIRGPGITPGTVVRALTGNVDLAPTFAAMAGVTPPPWVEGRSLLPLLAGAAPAVWRQAYLIEHDTQDAPRTLPGAGPAAMRPQEPADVDQQLGIREPDFSGLRADSFVYVEYATGERELYDLRTDPYQLENLAGRVPPETLSALSAWLADLRSCSGEGCRAAEARPLPSLGSSR